MLVSATIAQPDVTLVLDLDGVIRDATLANDVGEEHAAEWFGRRWSDTVGDATGARIDRMLDDARASGVSAFSQIPQLFPSGLEVPIEYTTVRLGGAAGMVAVGKSVLAAAELQSRLAAAQHALEQEYWKLREVETRYQMLFDMSGEPVMVLGAQSLSITEANPAAMRAVGLMVGEDFRLAIAPADRGAFHALLGRVRDQGRAPAILLRLGPERHGWMVRLSRLTADAAPAFLLQFAALAGQPAPRDVAPAIHEDEGDPRLGELLLRLPDGVAVLDEDGTIQSANDAFVDLVQMDSVAQVISASLGRWLARPDELGALLDMSARRGGLRGAVRGVVRTTIRGERGAELEVEISAAGNVDIRPRAIAVVMRDVSPRRGAAADGSLARSAVRLMSSEVGRMPLIRLVRETADLVERHYIAEALVMADGNRTEAASLLGLSRQSLYMKLHRYGMNGVSASAVEA